MKGSRRPGRILECFGCAVLQMVFVGFAKDCRVSDNQGSLLWGPLYEYSVFFRVDYEVVYFPKFPPQVLTWAAVLDKRMAIVFV